MSIDDLLAQLSNNDRMSTTNKINVRRENSLSFFFPIDVEWKFPLPSSLSRSWTKEINPKRAMGHVPRQTLVDGSALVSVDSPSAMSFVEATFVGSDQNRST